MSAPALLSPARRRQAAASLWVLSTAVATFSVGLALAGRIPASTPSYVSVLLAAATLGMNAAAVWLHRSAAHRRSTPAPEWSGWAGLIGPCLTGFAWTGAGAVLPIILTPLLTLFGAAGWLVWSGLEPVGRPAERMRSRGDAPQPAPQPAAPTSAGQAFSTAPNAAMSSRCTASTESAPPSAEAPVPAPDADVTQHIVRRRTAEGDVLEVTAALEFAPGEQRVSLHLPISPALSAPPEVECEPWEDVDLELQVGAAYPHGVRIDARRPGDVQAARRTMIGVLIRAVPQRRAA